jgi:hypothetical protein
MRLDPSKLVEVRLGLPAIDAIRVTDRLEWIVGYSDTTVHLHEEYACRAADWRPSAFRQELLAPAAAVLSRADWHGRAPDAVASRVDARRPRRCIMTHEAIE